MVSMTPPFPATFASGQESPAMANAYDRVIGKRSGPIDIEQLDSLVGRYEAIEIDIGTGDGRHVLDVARAAPERLVIGIDAVAENMAEASRKAASSARKGGLGNALFFRGAAERLPGPFAGLADLVTVNYPWGSLMRFVAEPEIQALTGMHALCKPAAVLRIHLNYTVISDRPYLERLGLGEMADPADSPDLPDAFLAAGFEISRREIFAGDPPVRTRWGRQLVRGAARRTLLIEATAQPLGNTP
jgi:16S rRNA (adenine(1408)-N(1))-methyltransferase